MPMCFTLCMVLFSSLSLPLSLSLFFREDQQTFNVFGFRRVRVTIPVDTSFCVPNTIYQTVLKHTNGKMTLKWDLVLR